MSDDSFNSSGATIVPDRHDRDREEENAQDCLPTQSGSGGRYHTRSRPSTGRKDGKGKRAQQPVGSTRQASNSSTGSVSGRTALRAVPSLVANARMLMPTDSLGRELEALAGGDGGGDIPQDGGPNVGGSQQGWGYVSCYLGTSPRQVMRKPRV